MAKRRERVAESRRSRQGFLERGGVLLAVSSEIGVTGCGNRLEPLDDRCGPRLGLKGRDFEPCQCSRGPLPEGRRSYGRG